MTPRKRHDATHHVIGCTVCGAQRTIVGYCSRCFRNCCAGCYNASETVCNTCLDALDADIAALEEEMEE